MQQVCKTTCFVGLDAACLEPERIALDFTGYEVYTNENVTSKIKSYGKICAPSNLTWTNRQALCHVLRRVEI